MRLAIVIVTLWWNCHFNPLLLSYMKTYEIPHLAGHIMLSISFRFRGQHISATAIGGEKGDWLDFSSAWDMGAAPRVVRAVVEVIEGKAQLGTVQQAVLRKAEAEARNAVLLAIGPSCKRLRVSKSAAGMMHRPPPTASQCRCW
jgi:hypothetical protein